jgi:hypothetical protein
MHRTTPPSAEPLEPRRLLAADLAGGLLRIIGTGGDDQITLELRAGIPDKYIVAINGEARTFDASRVTRGILVSGRRGDDVVDIDEQITLDARILGGKGDDELFAAGGDDAVAGGKGDDYLVGGDGDDRIRGGAGQDLFDSSDSRAEMLDERLHDSESQELDEVPQAVRDAVLQTLNGLEFETLAFEFETDPTVYELEWEEDGVPHSAKIQLDGSVVELEEEIDIADLPAAVSSAIESLFPRGEITEAETVDVPGTPTFYEVEVEAGRKVREIVVEADGDVIEINVERKVEEED